MIGEKYIELGPKEKRFLYPALIIALVVWLAWWAYKQYVLGLTQTNPNTPGTSASGVPTWAQDAGSGGIPTIPLNSPQFMPRSNVDPTASPLGDFPTSGDTSGVDRTMYNVPPIGTFGTGGIPMQKPDPCKDSCCGGGCGGDCGTGVKFQDGRDTTLAPTREIQISRLAHEAINSDWTASQWALAQASLNDIHVYTGSDSFY